MNDLLVKDEIDIENKIYEVRGKQVMFDSDLALLYQCKNGTKEINQAVKNNIEKFPERFSWKLTDEEFESLRSKFLTSKDRGGNRYNPRVFTEQGVAMLATILKSKVATVVSIRIMDVFVKLRKYVSNELVSVNNINAKLLEHDNRINLLEQTFSKFKENSNEIFYDGQIYDAYSKLFDIMSMAFDELVIVDAYADKSVLDIISNIKCNVILVCKTKSLLKEIDISKYYEQYDNLKIVYSDDFHDRFFLLDRDVLYHCGASINHAGSKTFCINRVDDDFVKSGLVDKLIKIGAID